MNTSEKMRIVVHKVWRGTQVISFSPGQRQLRLGSARQRGSTTLTKVALWEDRKHPGFGGGITCRDKQEEGRGESEKREGKDRLKASLGMELSKGERLEGGT